MLFSDLNLKKTSLEAIKEMGFVEPSEIQAESIPLLLASDIDFIGQAQTGTGKTAAFVLPLLEKIDLKSKNIQALILAPTRELANQIEQEIKKISVKEPVRSLAIYGGTSVGGQIRDLKKVRPQIVVGTPGRMMDFIDRGLFSFQETKFVVLDEADEMLDMGFFDDVVAIVEKVPEKRTWMFSATMPRPIKELIDKHFSDPVTVKVTKKILTSDAVDQQFVCVRKSQLVEALCRYLDFNENTYAIVFTRTKIGAKELADELNNRGYQSDALHGDMSQESRDMTMKKFKEKKAKLLVCTDVAARGIDVNDLTHVINFNLPQDNESYVHRIGRTGRGGSKGIALSIIDASELSRISQIERITKAKIVKIELPKVSEIKNRLLEKSLNEFKRFCEDEKGTPKEFTQLFSDLTKEELVQGLYQFVYRKTLKFYENAQEIDSVDKKNSSARGERSLRGKQRFFLNIGKMDGADPGELIRFISGTLGIRGSEIGRIDTKEKFAFIELPVAYTDQMLELRGEKWGNRKISIELAESRGGHRSSSRRPRYRSR